MFINLSTCFHPKITEQFTSLCQLIQGPTWPEDWQNASRGLSTIGIEVGTFQFSAQCPSTTFTPIRVLKLWKYFPNSQLVAMLWIHFLCETKATVMVQGWSNIQYISYLESGKQVQILPHLKHLFNYVKIKIKFLLYLSKGLTKCETTCAVIVVTIRWINVSTHDGIGPVFQMLSVSFPFVRA